MSELKFENQKIVDVQIEREMKKSYIDYAMSVIVGRALPDVRDGLKPVHRRILYAMYEDNLTHEKPYYKSATTVGNVLGKYHPHGDASVYDALVRMAQDFSLRYPLIDGHGNFGSIDGDPPAAYRYTEARMSKISSHLLADIEKNTVDFANNYDDKRKEPVVIPSRFPNLLVNGSSGIAVGMATNIPPHNLNEVVDGICHVIDNPECEIYEIMDFIQGPDFPTGGIIMGRSGIRAAYATGRGKIRVRAKADIEEWQNGRYKIAVTEIPYMVNKSRLVESIADLVRDKRIEGISDLRDESDRNGMRIVIELKRDANANVVLNQLYKYTQMQDTISMIMLALHKNQPKILNIREIIDSYITFQKEVVERRTRFDLKKASDRAHVLEGLKVATDNIDRIISIIRASANETEARDNLTKEPFMVDQMALIGVESNGTKSEFFLSEIQAKAIVDMRLGRLTGLEREKIDGEYTDLNDKIAGFEEILSSNANILSVVKEELIAIRDKFGDERRTEIENVENEIDIEDLIEETDCAYTLTHFGYIKRLPTNTYKSQKRGGRGVNAMATRDEDFVKTIFTASTHDNILFFTNFGKVYKLKGYQIPESSRTAKGMAIVNLLELDPDEKISAMFPIKEFADDKFLFFATKMGTVKRVVLSDLINIRRGGLRALNLNDGDAVVDVRLTDGTQNIMLATADGKAVCFDETEVRAMGRTAVGVRGISLAEGDYVIGAARARDEAEVLTITENGFGKRTPVAEYSVHHRGGKGVILHGITEKTGKIAGLAVVDNDNDIMIITDVGIIIRTAVDEIRLCGRSSQGVITMRTNDEYKVISIARTEKQEDDDEENDETSEQTSGEVLENSENTENIDTATVEDDNE